MTNQYIPVIGLEIHIELETKSKMFCGCPSDHFGKEPNSITCPVCLGLPGALPVPNKKAVEWTILLGLALSCEINEFSKFDRKHYFYPDLPKGYQISQYDQPFCKNGWLNIFSSFPRMRESSDSILKMDPRLRGDDEFEKRIRIRRVHLEEDTGKLQHAVVDLPADATHQALQAGGKNVSLVDFNRSGVPLVEIVTEPDFRTVEEVDLFVRKIQQIVRYLGISGADMEKGSMRIEPSVSLRLMSLRGAQATKQSLPCRQEGLKIATPRPTSGSRNDVIDDLPDYRVEIKNINSFKFARRAIEYEIERQKELFEQGKQPEQQTRGFVEAKGITVVQREKEEAHDYRYFPEPDIPPMRFAQAQIAKLKAQIGELPDEKRERFIKEYRLSDYDAGQLIETRERAEYFELCVNASTRQRVNDSLSPKTIANWIINKKINIEELSPEEFLNQIVSSTQTSQMSDAELEKIIKQVLAENPKAVEDYKKGNTKVSGFFIGLVARHTQLNVEPSKILSIIQKLLV